MGMSYVEAGLGLVLVVFLGLILWGWERHVFERAYELFKWKTGVDERLEQQAKAIRKLESKLVHVVARLNTEDIVH